eukprot:1158488-Pelagomonas_calceolata.AAC.5
MSAISYIDMVFEVGTVVTPYQVLRDSSLCATSAQCQEQTVLFLCLSAQSKGQYSGTLLHLISPLRPCVVAHDIQDLDTDAPASNNPIMRSELRSRCVLCAWVAHCLLHAAACAAHPILERFGVGVCWEDLGHLVLSDRWETGDF